MKRKKTWQEKLADDKDCPKFAQQEGETSRFGTGSMVIPRPMDVKELMDRIPKGKITTINELRAALARKYNADMACPITTGIFAWIAAHAAEEAAAEGQKRITPYWRTLKNNGELNAKYPGGLDAVRLRLEAEGHSVVSRGKRYFVENYARVVASP
jgi:hypothetical protein